jgi:RND family efflux transporter MFP subunit
MLQAKIEQNRHAPADGAAPDHAPIPDPAPASDRESTPSTAHEPPPCAPLRTSAEPRLSSGSLRRMIAVFVTLASVVIAAILGRATWRAYVETPWTRDGTVRAYVVTMAPEVFGRIVELRVSDNQFVHKGDLLMVIDPTDYRIAVSRASAALRQAELDAENAARLAERRQSLAKLDAVTLEQAQTFGNAASVAQAQVDQAKANLRQARTNLERTEIRSPVNGWVTNLLIQREDFATVGQNEISLIDADSFWVDAYFEETQLASIRESDGAEIQLLGYKPIVRGHVDSVSRGIYVANAQQSQQGLATVSPIFTWVRLAQRVPVRIHVDDVPPGVQLVAGMTATVRIGARTGAQYRGPH